MSIDPDQDLQLDPGSGAMAQLSDVARVLDAPLFGADAGFQRVVTDTRGLRPGDLFVALRGERFDGRDFARRAATLGAVCSLVDAPVPGAATQIVVDDTLLALQRYAADWRSRFSLPVIAVTGSNGKTTTKQLLAAICTERGPVLATEGNLNNHIGVPLTLLQIRDAHRTAVVELGANHAGEIAALAALARPGIGIVTLAGDAHLEGFGSHEGIARAKGELFSALRGGVAVINVDDRFAPLWRAMAADAGVLGFGFAASADVRAEAIVAGAEDSRFRLRTPTGDAEVLLPLPGRHNVANALAAAAAGIALGLSADVIAAGLARVRTIAGRTAWKRSREGARILDDSYNANPTSLRAALELIAALPGRRWLVLGDMKELGPRAIELHEEAGRTARLLGIDRVYSTGELARHAAESYGRGRHFDSVEALNTALQADLEADVIVLVKGSRSSKMERVVAALTGTAGEGVH